MATLVSIRSFIIAAITVAVLLPAAIAFGQSTSQNQNVEAQVRQYFTDVPSMIEIARCESGFRQYGPDGLVLFDPSYTMIGVFQISAAHLPEAYTLGKDVMTPEGNLAYARYLYETNGIDPWMSSFSCWGNAVKSLLAGSTSTSTPASPSTLSLSLGMSSGSVVAIQQMLNKAGFTVAASGPGSVGNETTMFGSLTRAAVRRFQCAQNITCSGDESTTGYGLVNDRTYQALAAAANGTPSTPANNSADKAAEIAKVQAQITSLTNELGALQTRLKELTQ